MLRGTPCLPHVCPYVALKLRSLDGGLALVPLRGSLTVPSSGFVLM